MNYFKIEDKQRVLTKLWSAVIWLEAVRECHGADQQYPDLSTSIEPQFNVNYEFFCYNMKAWIEALQLFEVMWP